LALALALAAARSCHLAAELMAVSTDLARRSVGGYGLRSYVII
jgi:hypothetical protein